MHRQDFEPILLFSAMNNIQSAKWRTSCPRMHFSVSKAPNILNGYNLGGWMKLAQISDSKTHVKSKIVKSKIRFPEQK